MLQHVFISYRHETPEHARAVRRLGELLRQAKIPVALDQFHLDEHPGGPDLGWPQWSEDCAHESACVLIVASEGWFAAYNKTDDKPAVGLGAVAEANIIRQWLYDHKNKNTRIRLAFLHEIDAEKVPPNLRAWQQFRPFNPDDQLNQLIRWVAGCLGMDNIGPPTVRWPEPMEFRHNLADRSKEEWPAIVELLGGRSRQRILLYEGASGLGKSTLVRQATLYAKNLGIPVVHVDLKGGGITIEDILGQFDLELGKYLPNFTREGSNKTHLLRRDLRNLRQPVLVIFDTYEGSVGNETVVDWINRQLLAEVETALGLAVIVAGQQVPDYKHSGWYDLARYLPLLPIVEIEHWKSWVEHEYPEFRKTGADLYTVVLCAQGNPKNVSELCQVISER